MAKKEARLKVWKTYKLFIGGMVHARMDQPLPSVSPLLDKEIEIT